MIQLSYPFVRVANLAALSSLSVVSPSLVASAKDAETFEARYESLETHETPKWFRDAKLGIFVHWGIYSVPAWAPLGTEAENMEGVEWFENNPYAEWYWNSMRLGDTPTKRYHDKTYGTEYDYYRFAAIFNEAIADWDPSVMAEAFKQTQARYVVLTTKHHDGFTLWPSEASNPTLDDETRQASRDIVGELAQAVRNEGMRMGLYYSGGIDWSFRPVVIDGTQGGPEVTPDEFEYPKYADTHLRELIESYRPDIIWNDIRYPGGSELLEIVADYYNSNADGLINDRWGSSVKVPSDFETMEYKQFDTIQEFVWEANRGIGASFGYNLAEDSDEHLLSGSEIIELLVDVVSKNGNLLLNVGPKADGSIPDTQLKRLESLGSWMEVNGEAIFETRPWQIATAETGGEVVHFTQNADEDVLYLFVKDDADRQVSLTQISAREGTTVSLLSGDGAQRIELDSDGSGLRFRLPEGVSGIAGGPHVIRMQPRPELGMGESPQSAN